jgi:hypothetical protein
MAQHAQATTVRFKAPVVVVDDTTLVRLPEPASKELPSRGQVSVRGTINGHEFQTVVEPDGVFGHWIRIDAALQKSAALGPGDRAALEIEPVKEWPEPSVPKDFRAALKAAPTAIQDMWSDITPMARWEWVRWINETRNPDTRKKRIEVSISKMQGGKRRPCCFNLAACTDPKVSKSGKLREPE